jgi:prepilin peptidase CpaA
MSPVLTFVLIALVITAAIYDFRYRRIPNWLNLSGVILGLGLNTLDAAQHGLWVASLGIGLAIVLYVPLYLLRAMGAGDVKLMAAVGSIVGPQNWLVVFLCTALAGGMLALVVIIRQHRVQQTLTNVTVLAGELTHFRRPADRHESLDVRNSRSTRLPHGLAIAVGSLAFVVLRPFTH